VPGITGVVSRRPEARWELEVAEMVRATEHEPFYVSGTHSWPEMGIYCGWVAHQDSFASDQVFHSREHDVALVLSGECFLDPESRSLLQRGRHTVEAEDGSWLIPLYLELGDGFFDRLNGLFSGLLVDQRQRKAFLFNDRYGMERLYWHETEEAFFFASEAKSLLRVIPELREFDWQGVAQVLSLGCTVGEQTLFRGIQLAPGGSLFSFADGHCLKTRYFLPEEWAAQSVLSAESFQEEFEGTYKRILPRYFEAKSNIGISLTAGLDTRMIMACMPSRENVLSYTFSGTKRQTLDDRLAARVASACQVPHQLLRIGPDFFTNFRTHVDKTIYATDGCFGILGAHEIYLTREARRLAPTRLTGNFGSEVLRGITTFKGVGVASTLLNPQVNMDDSVSATDTIPGAAAAHPVTFAAFQEIPFSLFGSFAAGRAETVFRSPYLDNEIVALAYRMPDQSRRSPNGALRLIYKSNPVLAEIPTDMGLNATSNRLVSQLRYGWSKATFKLDYFNNEGLPHWLSAVDPLVRSLDRIGLIGLHKYLHYRSWFNKELSGYIRDAFDDVLTRRSAFWNIDSLQRIRCEQAAGRKNCTAEINAVLTLDAVERLLLRSSSVAHSSTVDQSRGAVSSVAV
jgi:asparagine synthase (glutamine-hydrolysing)